MPEDKVQVGASEAPEAGLPKPSFETPSQPAGSELSAEAIAKQDEQRLKDTEERLWRKIQSKLDKDTAEVRKTYGDLSEVQTALAEVKAGGDPDKIYAALEQRRLYEKVAELESKISSPTQSSPNGKAEADEAFDKAVGLVTEAGLANDPEVQELFKTFKGKPDDFVIEVGRKVIARNTQKAPAAASATSPAGGGGAAVTLDSATDKVNELTAQYAKASAPSQRAELKTKLAEARAELEKLEAQG